MGFKRVDLWCSEVLGASSIMVNKEKALCAWICWHIWKNMFCFVFKGKMVDPLKKKEVVEQVLGSLLRQRAKRKEAIWRRGDRRATLICKMGGRCQWEESLKSTVMVP